MPNLSRYLPLLACSGLVFGCGDSADDGGTGAVSGSSAGGNAGSQTTSVGGSASGSPGMAMGGRNGGGGRNGSGNSGTGTSGSGGTASLAGSSDQMDTAGTGNANDPYGDARTRCVNRTNELRATKGLPPIPRLAKAESCADGQAKTDSEANKAHSAFNACLDQVKWMGAGQNECPGYGSVEDTLKVCLDAMWAEGPGGGHYDNMVGKSTHTACGFYTTAAGKVWMVEDFWTE